MKNKQVFQKIVDVGLLVIFLLFPLTINIALISPEDFDHPIISINFSFIDLIMGIVLFLWIVKIIIFKEYKKLKLPTVPLIIFVIVGAFSFVNTISTMQWIKEMVQLIEYFILFYILLINNFKSINANNIKYCLLLLATFVLILAFFQYYIKKGSPYLVRGLFDNRVTFGVFMCFIVPLIFTELLIAKNRLKIFWLITLLLFSYLTILSISAFFSIIIGLTVITFLLNNRKLNIRYITAIVLLLIIYPILLPKQSMKEVNDFLRILEQGSVSENYYRRLTILGNIAKKEFYRKNVKENLLIISSNIPKSSQLPSIRKGDAYKELEGERIIKSRYVEMQAAINLLSENTLTGVGLGNYQDRIGSYYKDIRKINTSEPNQNNTYLVIGSTMGLLGLSAFIWILCSILKLNIEHFKKCEDPRKKMEYIGLFGSSLTIILVGFFSTLLTAASMVPLIGIIFLSNIHSK